MICLFLVFKLYFKNEGNSITAENSLESSNVEDLLVCEGKVERNDEVVPVGKNHCKEYLAISHHRVVVSHCDLEQRPSFTEIRNSKISIILKMCKP